MIVSDEIVKKLLEKKGFKDKDTCSCCREKFEKN